MEPRKNSSLNEEKNERLNQPGLSSEDRVSEEVNPDTTNVARNIEEGDEDYDDEEELVESDFDIDEDDDDDEEKSV